MKERIFMPFNLTERGKYSRPYADHTKSLLIFWLIIQLDYTLTHVHRFKEFIWASTCSQNIENVLSKLKTWLHLGHLCVYLDSDEVGLKYFSLLSHAGIWIEIEVNNR